MRFKPLLVLILISGIITVAVTWKRYYPNLQVLWKVGLLPASASVVLDQGVPSEYQGQLQLFILIGQSNMSGRGSLIFPAAWHPNIFEFGNDYRWRVATEPIDSTVNQIDQVSMEDANERAGFSPALSFAHVLVKTKPNMLIGLIPCSKGNTTIEDWHRSLSYETLYGSCLARVKAASPMGQVAGVLIFQGESDALDPERFAYKSPSPTTYATKFSIFVNHLRNDLAQPTLPVIFAQIGMTTTPDIFVNWKAVQTEQQMVHLPCTEMITTDDLPLRDFVHFTTDSYKIIGKRFAEAYLNLIERYPGCA